MNEQIVGAKNFMTYIVCVKEDFTKEKFNYN